MPKPKTKPTQQPVSGPAVSAEDALNGFDIADVLEGRNRPGYDDPDADRRWREARRYVQRIADERYDPRQVLEMTASEAERWREARLLWVHKQIEKRD
jgi:hypothetical protein